MSVRSNATAVGAFVLGAIADRHRHRRGVRQRPAVQGRQALRHLLRGLARGARRRCSGQVSRRADRPGGRRSGPRSSRSERSVDIPVVIELTQDAVEGVEEWAARPWRPLIEEGLRARLELASLITGQLYVGLNIFPGTPIREVPNPTDYRSDPIAYLRCRPGCSETLSDLHRRPAEAAQGPRPDARAIELHDCRRRCRGDGQGGAARRAAGRICWPTRRGRWSRRSTSCRP